MRPIVITFGLIAGIICGMMFFVISPTDGEINFDNGQLYGYITMTIALSTIFFAVKQYRDKYHNGEIKFGKAFLVGLYITLIAAVVYVLAWELYYNNYAQDFGDKYVEYMRGKLESQGISAAEIDNELASLTSMMESYKTNTLMRMGLTMTEILPVGLIISLISALLFGFVLKKKTTDPIEQLA